MMLQLELTNLFVSPKLFKTRKVFDDNTHKIPSLEFEEFMWKYKWDFIFCWIVVVVAFDLDIGDTIYDL